MALDDRLDPDWEAFGERAGDVAGIAPDAVFWKERRWSLPNPVRPVGTALGRAAGSVSGAAAAASGVASSTTGRRRKARSSRSASHDRRRPKGLSVRLASATEGGRRRGRSVRLAVVRPPADAEPELLPSTSVLPLRSRVGGRDRTKLIRQGSLVTAIVAALALLAVILVPGGEGLETATDTSAPTETAADTTSDPLALRNDIRPSTSATDRRVGGGIGTGASTSGSTAAADTDASPGAGSESGDRPGTTGAETTATAAETTASSDGSTSAVPTSGSSTSDSSPGSTGTSSAPTTGTSEPSSSTGSTATTAATTSSSEATTSSSEATTSSTEPTTSSSDPTTSSTEATSTTEATTSSSVGSSACSSPTWNLVLDEQFSGSSVDSGRWSAYNSTGNAGHGLRRPSALSVSGGYLTITASMENGNLVSGGMEHRHDQTYGRYEFRVRTDQDPSEAMSGVVMTWPQSDVHPRDGENNIYETLATPGDRHEFYTFIHKPFGTTSDQDYTVHPVNASSWHTMVMEWTPDWIKLYRDGVLVKTIDETSADLIPDVAHHATIQLDAWKDTLPADVTMQVDYIKVYSFGGC